MKQGVKKAMKTLINENVIVIVIEVLEIITVISIVLLLSLSLKYHFIDHQWKSKFAYRLFLTSFIAFLISSIALIILLKVG